MLDEGEMETRREGDRLQVGCDRLGVVGADGATKLAFDGAIFKVTSDKLAEYEAIYTHAHVIGYIRAAEIWYSQHDHNEADRSFLLEKWLIKADLEGLRPYRDSSLPTSDASMERQKPEYA